MRSRNKVFSGFALALLIIGAAYIIDTLNISPESILPTPNQVEKVEPSHISSEETPKPEPEPKIEHTSSITVRIPEKYEWKISPASTGRGGGTSKQPVFNLDINPSCEFYVSVLNSGTRAIAIGFSVDAPHGLSISLTPMEHVKQASFAYGYKESSDSKWNLIPPQTARRIKLTFQDNGLSSGPHNCSVRFLIGSSVDVWRFQVHVPPRRDLEIGSPGSLDLRQPSMKFAYSLWNRGSSSIRVKWAWGHVKGLSLSATYQRRYPFETKPSRWTQGDPIDIVRGGGLVVEFTLENVGCEGGSYDLGIEFDHYTISD